MKYFGIINLMVLILLICILGYLFIQLMKLSIQFNDIKYYVEKPIIPFKDPVRFDYTIDNSSKNLL